MKYDQTEPNTSTQEQTKTMVNHSNIPLSLREGTTRQPLTHNLLTDLPITENR